MSSKLGLDVSGRLAHRFETSEGARYTLQQILDFEADELENDTREQAMSIIEKHHLDIRKAKRGDVKWVTFDKHTAIWYAKPAGDDNGDADDAEYEDQITSWILPRGSLVVADDGDNGYLVWQSALLSCNK